MMNHDDGAAGTLLVVDDNEMNRDMLSRRLGRRGHTVHVAADGHEALEKVQRDHYDLVLLDVMMPGIDGLQTLQMIRGIRSATDLPVIMATAKGESMDIVNALQIGANDYVTKPLDFPVVLARVQTQLSLKRAVDRIRQLERDLQARNRELEAMNKRMKNDLEEAAKIQQGGLPRIMPQIDGVSFAWSYRPCDELGGDSLNIFQLDDQHVGLYVLDVSGHGVPAALLSVSLHRQLMPRRDTSCVVLEPDDSFAAFGATSPTGVMTQLNQSFSFDEQNKYFTMLYGLLNLDSRRFRFTSAGHPGPVHVPCRPAGPRSCDVSGFPVGIVADAGYGESELDMSTGDRLFLYSDGIVEQQNGDGEQFGRKRLMEAIDGARSLSLQEAVDDIRGQVQHWCRDCLNDDLSLLAMELH